MTLREFLFGSNDTTDDHIDHYRISHQRNGSGWKPVDGYDDLDEPITKSTFEYTEAPLDPGQYKLFAVKNNLHTQLPEGEGWKLIVEDDTADEPQPIVKEIRELREQIEESKAEEEQTDDID